MYQPSTAPQAVGGILDSGFALFRDSVKDTFALALLSGLLAAPFSRLAQNTATADVTFGSATTQLLISLASMAVTLFFYAAIIARIGSIRNGRHMLLGDALGVAVNRFPAMFGGFVLFMLALVVGFLLLVIPGLYLMIALGFVFFAAVLERKGAVESLLYSHNLVRGHWWRTALLVVTIGVVAVVLYLVLGLIVGIVLAMSGGAVDLAEGNLPWYVDFVVNPLLSSVVVPLTCALFIEVYADLRLRREGGDFEQSIASAEA